MKFVADIDIPFLKGVLEPYGEVVYKKGLDICRDDIVDADALLIRTRTRCDEDLQTYFASSTPVPTDGACVQPTTAAHAQPK